MNCIKCKIEMRNCINRLGFNAIYFNSYHVCDKCGFEIGTKGGIINYYKFYYKKIVLIGSGWLDNLTKQTFLFKIDNKDDNVKEKIIEVKFIPVESFIKNDYIDLINKLNKLAPFQ